MNTANQDLLLSLLLLLLLLVLVLLLLLLLVLLLLLLLLLLLTPEPRLLLQSQWELWSTVYSSPDITALLHSVGSWEENETDYGCYLQPAQLVR